ncbi:transcriptional repressor [Litoricolaceae bacterium]|jgi:Fur family zinc uptake transcriptional regulator|nr:transcriptional repressor [Litorivicinaceae bacterium]MDB2401766.1 transcriptional repressor [Litorivicinaceae bacterium]MDB2424719.1 transcriptional repressor [Litorivicinaceae bacterium]
MADLKLTKNQTLVLSVLEESSIPLSAYTILERLGEHGLRAPPQVYRALDKLLDLGLAHKLASMNSFLACQHTQCGSHQVTSFAICDGCEQVSEIINTEFERQLNSLAKDVGLQPTRSTIEIHGLCDQCSSSNPTT